MTKPLGLARVASIPVYVSIAAALIAGTGLSMVPAVTASAVTPTALPDALAVAALAYAGRTPRPSSAQRVAVFTNLQWADAHRHRHRPSSPSRGRKQHRDQQVPLSAQFDDTGYRPPVRAGEPRPLPQTPLVFQVGLLHRGSGLRPVPQDTIINGQIDASPTPWTFWRLSGAPLYRPGTGPWACTSSGTGCYLAGWRNLLLGQPDRQLLAVNVRPHAHVTTGTPIRLGRAGCADVAQGGTNHWPLWEPPYLGANAYYDAGAHQGRQLLRGPAGGDDFWSVSQATAGHADVILNGSLVFPVVLLRDELPIQQLRQRQLCRERRDQRTAQLVRQPAGIAVNTDSKAPSATSGTTSIPVISPPGYTRLHRLRLLSTEELSTIAIASGAAPTGSTASTKSRTCHKSPVSEKGPFLYTQFDRH